MTTELIVGGSGADATEVIFPKAANKLVGTKFKIVLGYPARPSCCSRWSAARRKASAASAGPS